MTADPEFWNNVVRLQYLVWRQAEADLVDNITTAREFGVTWQGIADQLGHGNRNAARRWHQRRINERKQT